MSGGRIYGNKRVHGRRELRDIFIGAAESALRTETKLREYYDGLRGKGLNDKEAKIALARKIAALCLSLLKNNDVYRDYNEHQIRRTQTRKELNLESAEHFLDNPIQQGKTVSFELTTNSASSLTSWRLASGEMEILGLFRMEDEAQCSRGRETIMLHMRVVQQTH
jgi:hypothetical protein